MDITAITQLISSIGFPIVACIGIGWFVNKQTQQQREDNAKREERMLGQLDKFSDALNSFNLTLEKIDSRLTNIEKTIDN